MKKHIRYSTFQPETVAAFELFKQKDGSAYIATPVTLQAMLDLNREFHFNRALEMGSGIGTITYMLLKYTNAHVDTYEDNEFCKSALKTNLAGFEDRYTLLTDYRQAPPERQYSLVIVDGGSGKSWDGGTMSVVQRIAAAVESPIFFIEGERPQQRTLLRRELAKRYVYQLVQYDYATYNGVLYKGALAIMCTPSANALMRRLNFLYWELIEWTPIRYALTYRLARLKKRLGFS